MDSNNKCNTLKTDKLGKAGYIVFSQKRQQQRSVADEIQPAFPRTKIHYLLCLLQKKLYCSTIAEIIGVHRSTVSRELQRNAGSKSYRFGVAARLINFMQQMKPERKFFLFGNEDGAKQTIIAVANGANKNLLGVIALDSPAEWPFDNLSPVLHVDKIKVPVLLISSFEESYNDTLTLYNKAKSKDIEHSNIKNQAHHSEIILGIIFNKLSGFIEQVYNSTTHNPAERQNKSFK